MAKQGSRGDRKGPAAASRRGAAPAKAQARSAGDGPARDAHPTGGSGQPPLVSTLQAAFAAVLVLLVLANFLYRPIGHFGVEDGFAFFAWFSFVACVGLIVVSRFLGVFLKRAPDYYDMPPERPADEDGRSREQGR